MNLMDGKHQAWEFFNKGHIKKAYDIVDILNANYPNDADVKYLLGCCLGKFGKFSEAVETLKSSLEISPMQAQTYLALGRALRAVGNIDDAIKNFKVAFDLDPVEASTHIALGDAYLFTQNINLAKHHFTEASRLMPSRPVPHYNLGLIARHEDANAESALKHFIKALNLAPTVAEYLNAVGECFLQLERYDEAVIKFTSAIKINSEYLQARSNLLEIYVKVGEYTKAESLINYALRINEFSPAVANSFLLICKHIDRCEDALEYASHCLEELNLSESITVNLHRQMAMVLDYLQRYDKAWFHLTKSKATQSLIGSYDPIVHKKIIDILTEAFTSATLLNIPNSGIEGSDGPIFIVGMPRSGTSLTEQILSAHPNITGAGELTYISELIEKFPTAVKSTKPWPECIHDVSQQQLAVMANSYLSSLDTAFSSSRYVTDKMPHNFYALGFIQMLFPKAKIIHCKRNSMDTCLSIYFQNFLVGHDYSNDLFNLGTHYYQYQRLMQHWQKHLSLDIFDVEYESLVSNPKQVIANMLEFCELDWSEDCMYYYAHNRTVSTASFDQVRQKLHNKSVGRWKNYKQYLNALEKGFERGF